MKLIPYNPKELTKNFRLSVHRTGRIGFSSDAAEKLRLIEHNSATISRNGDDPKDTNLYLILHRGKEDGYFKINTNGPYYSINIKVLLDAIGMPYDKGQASFDMEEIEIEGQKVYKLERKDKPKSDPILESAVVPQ